MKELWLRTNLTNNLEKNGISSFQISSFFDVEDLQGISSSLISFFEEIFPYLHSVTIMICTISLLIGGIIYLLDENEKNGKKTIFRSLIMLILYILIFKDIFLQLNINIREFEQLQSLSSYISFYLLFILASLSLILFIGTCGLYVISPNSKLVERMRKCIICFLAVIIPLGINFPKFPQW